MKLRMFLQHLIMVQTQTLRVKEQKEAEYLQFWAKDIGRDAASFCSQTLALVEGIVRMILNTDWRQFKRFYERCCRRNWYFSF